MKNVFLFASVAVASGILFVNVYNSLIDARSWGGSLPDSMGAAREYYKAVNPGNFFRVFSPLNQVLALLVVILFWKAFPSARLFLSLALICYVAGDVFTFAYFYPRNDIMFKTAQLTDIATIKQAWSQWSVMNWLRSAIILAGVVFSFVSITRIFQLNYQHGG